MNIKLTIQKFILTSTALVSCCFYLKAADSKKIFAKERGGWRHIGEYQPPSIVWQPELNVPNVRQVIPHPQADAVAAAISDNGIYLTTNGGDTWEKAKGISKGLAEEVTSLTFQDNKSSNFLLGTKSKGIWISRDYGKTCRQLAKKSQGLASDYIESVYFQLVDMSFNTILAGHGGKAPGISRSADGGKTWEVLYPKFHCYRLYQGRIGTQAMYMMGTDLEEKDVQNIYSISSLGKYWRRTYSDVLLNDAITNAQGVNLNLATVDAGLIRIYRYGQSVDKLGHDDVEWSSIGRSWYNTADSTQIFLYEPEKFGFAQSLDNLKTIKSLGKGPYKGRIVQEGAQIRSTAGGAVYFAAVNGNLYIGRNNNNHRVEKVTITPATINIAQSVLSGQLWSSFDQTLEDFTKSKHSKTQVKTLVKQLKEFSSAIGTRDITINAKVTSQKSTTGKVTVDLSRIGGSYQTTMYDDGKHDDGKPGDGIYGVRFPLQHTMLSSNSQDWRPRWPGSMGLTVTALSSNGQLAGGVGTLGIFIKPESFYFWNGGWIHAWASKGSSCERKRIQERGKPTRNEMEVTTSAGPWYVRLNGKHNNISGYYAVGLEIMPLQNAVETIKFQLQDQPVFTAPVSTPPEIISSGKHVQGGTLKKDKWTKVSIPIEQILKDTDEFVPELFANISLSGNDKSSKQYRLKKIRFFRTKKDLHNWLETKEQ